MISVRSVGTGLHRRTQVLACLAALVTAFAVSPCRAQSTETSPVSGLDSTGASLPDSARPDSARPDSGRSDSMRSDSMRSDSTATPARPAPPPAPVDSALGAACEGSGGGLSDLLVVTFRSSTTASEREAVAREAGGTLVGTSEYAAPGAWFLRVPGSAGDRSVADRLILFSPVLEVGTTRCPS